MRFAGQALAGYFELFLRN